MPFYFNFLMTNGFYSYEERREEEGEKVKPEEKFPKLPFLDIYLKNQHLHFLMHGHFSWSTSSFTSSQGPNFFKNKHFKKLDHESVIMKCDHG